MINPKTILGEWVAALRSCPDLVTAIGGNPENIWAFMEGLADHNNLRLAILQMLPGSILVAWNGTTPRRLTGGALHFAHRFSIYHASAGTELDSHVCRSVLAAGERNPDGRSVVVIALAFPDRPRLLPALTTTVFRCADGRSRSIRVSDLETWVP